MACVGVAGARDLRDHDGDARAAWKEETALAKNPYSVLGVATTATDAEIRTAFRALAKKYHPDRNPNDRGAEERFKEISAAFDILGDTGRRRKFDNGQLDADGRERSGFQRRQPGRAGDPFGAGGSEAGDFSDLSDLFSDLFGAGRRDGARPRGAGGGYRESPVRGRDMRYRLEIDFMEAVSGAKKRVTMPDGRVLDLAVPIGLDNGQTLRLKGQGEPGAHGGVNGDVYVEVNIRAHRVFKREGTDIHLEVPISLKEAVLGGKITVPTIDGDVAVKVPRYADSGAVLRLRGRGVKDAADGVPGDQFVKLRIVLPEGGDVALEEFVQRWDGGDAHSPRAHFADASGG